MDENRRIKKYVKYLLKDIYVYILDMKLKNTPPEHFSEPEKYICDICYMEANKPVKCKKCKTTFCMEHVLKAYFVIFFNFFFIC
jgi:hypothetical protein